MIIIDTNVVSELMKPIGDRMPAVVAWARAREPAQLFTTSVTVGELFAGVELLRESRRKDALRSAAEAVCRDFFAGRILDYDERAAREFGVIMALRRRAGNPMSTPDGQIVAIAKARGMAIASRDRDVADCGVAVIDPWQAT